MSFGSFRLLPFQRVLLEGDQPLKLGSRAFDILAALLERAGETIGKAELMARVWPDTVVEEANLRVHVAALRKVLRCGQQQRYIENVAGRGYCFIAPVQRRQAASLPAARAGWPITVSTLAGRGEALAQLEAQLQEHRLVSLVGAGGAGKTALALAAAHALANRLPFCFADLSTVTTPGRLVPAVALALGLGVQPLPAVLQHLRERSLLLILDNCEHVIDSAAAFAEQALQHAPQLRILATSREALRAADEWVHRLPGLQLPPRTITTAHDALRWPAVALFAERAGAVRNGFVLRDEDVAPLLQLCSALDGLPLALELAAARVDLFSVQEMAARLDERFQLLNRGRRTAPPRQQSLLASLDWSYRTLTAAEQRVLQRLSLWRSPFDMPMACAAMQGAGLSAGAIEDAIVSLSARSLLYTCKGGDTLVCGLPDTVALYGRQQLAMDEAQAQAAHAQYAQACITQLAQLEADWQCQPADVWRKRHAPMLPNVRSALAWCFGPQGDANAGMALLLASGLLWVEMLLLDEQRQWLEQALERVAQGADSDPLTEMKLCSALGNALFHLHGGDASAAAFARAFAIAEANGDLHQLALAFSGLCSGFVMAGDYAAALQLGERFQAGIRYAGSRDAQLVHDRVTAMSLHLSGDQRGAERLAQQVMHQRQSAQRRTRASAVHYDQYVAAGVVLARARWLQGYPEHAQQLADAAVARARHTGDRISECYALTAAAFPVAWWNGELAGAAAALRALAELNAERSHPYWNAWGERYEALLARQSPAAGPQHHSPRRGPQIETLLTLDGRYLDAETVGRVEAGQAGWCAPEVLRLQGDAALADGQTGAARRAGHLYRQALDLARSQGALAWELRCATSLSALWHREGSTEAACELLDGVLARFSEGFGTADLQAATQLLARMENAAVLRRARRRDTAA
ncbi:ATP-binding protein [Massilia sp. SM-13]|uniref:ATP-binding protein n=1 Tax=Pseudoduganella rhizocola TaxID=3382643 RepID=UPI0038B5FD85